MDRHRHDAVIDLRTSTVVEFPTLFDPFLGEAPLIERGLHLTPWYYRGRRWLFIVDHTHSVLHLEPVQDYGDRDTQVSSLWTMLDALDPVGVRRLK